MFVQAFVAKLAIEAFDEGVLDSYALSNEAQLQAAGVRPSVERSAAEFGRCPSRGSRAGTSHSRMGRPQCLTTSRSAMFLSSRTFPGQWSEWSTASAAG